MNKPDRLWFLIPASLLLLALLPLPYGYYQFLRIAVTDMATAPIHGPMDQRTSMK